MGSSKASPSPSNRTRGEKNEKYSTIWSSIDKVTDYHTRKSMEALRDVCKIHDQDIGNVKEIMAAMCAETAQQIREEMTTQVQEWKNEIYAEITAHFTSWKMDIETSLQERNRVIEELKHELEEHRHQLDLLKKEEGEITDTTPTRMQTEINELKTHMTTEINTWANIVKRAQAEVAENSKWIEVAKKAPTKKDEFVNAALEEEKKRKLRALHIRVVGWKEGSSPLADAEKICEKMGIEDPKMVENAWRVGKDLTKGRPLILKFASLDSRRAFLAKRTALKGEKVYLEDDLTPAQVAHRKECMPQILEARKAGKWAVYRDGRVIITDKRQ